MSLSISNQARWSERSDRSQWYLLLAKSPIRLCNKDGRGRRACVGMVYTLQNEDKTMKAAFAHAGRNPPLVASTSLAVILASTWLGLPGATAAGEIKDPPRFASKADYSSLKDWFLQAENIVPYGSNPLYFPLKPGQKFILERPNHPDGHYRKETVVLSDKEPFDIPGIGKFETAVVQEEEYMDGVLTQRALNWEAMDKTTNSVYAFGEVSWEINEEGKPNFSGTWRAGEPDGNGLAEPGLLMPGTLTLGSRYLFDGSESEAFGGSEVVETGIEKNVPAGKFKDCVRVREQSLQHLDDITDKVWCPHVGIVSDTSDALPASEPGSDVSSIGKYLKNPLPYTPPVAKVSGDQAVQIAQRVIPGKVTSLKIERKRGKNVYVVEIMTNNAGEKDVFVDIESGEVVGTD
jgi:Peptidase propeptide and YPEB domain